MNLQMNFINLYATTNIQLLDDGDSSKDDTSNIKSQQKRDTNKSPETKTHSHLKVLSANANSLKNKMLSLQFNVELLKPDVIIIQETKIKRKSQIKLNGYRLFPILFHSPSTIMVEALSLLGTGETKVIVLVKLFTSMFEQYLVPVYFYSFNGIHGDGKVIKHLEVQ